MTMMTQNASKNITIKLKKLYPWQQELRDAPQRHRMVIASRQSGKTLAATQIAIEELLRGGRVLWVAPVYSQTKEIFCAIRDKLMDLISYISTPTEIKLLTAGHIWFRSADRPDRLRSLNYTLVIFDEFAFADEEAYKVIRPTLSATQGRMLIISTPNGHNHLYDLYDKAKDLEDWYTTKLDWTVSKHLLPDEIAKAQLEMSPGEFKQEYMAEFVSPKNAIFKAEWLTDLFIDSLPETFQRKIIAIDLSLGKDLKSDFQAIVFVGVMNNVLYVDAYAERMPITTLNEKIKDLYTYYRPEGVAFESNGFQVLVAHDFTKLFTVPPNVLLVNNDVKKETRISRLSSLLAQKRIKILRNSGGMELFRELSDFGSKNALHDDVMDALEMAWRTLVET